MKIIVTFLIFFKSLAVVGQYSFYETSDPREFYVDTKFVSSHSIFSCQSENYQGSKYMGSGITYFDSLGRQSCYDVFDSLGKIRYTGRYYYDSNLMKANKFIGIHHPSSSKYEENFYKFYEGSLLKKDSSDQNFGTDYLFYDSLGREIKRITIFKDSDWVRTILKGYSNLNNNLNWAKDFFRKNGNEHLDSYRQFLYDEKANLLKTEELVTNNDSSSNTNRGTMEYFYNSQGLNSQIVELGIVNEFEYNLSGLLSKSSTFFKETDKNKYLGVTKYIYTFY